MAAPQQESPPALPPLREVIARHGLSARHGLGQHFLFDLNLTGRIARAAGELSAGTVIEIGPGPGGLTRALLAAGATRVIAIERDERCAAALDELRAAWPGRLEIVIADALAIDAAALGASPRRIVANLPYNVATALLLHWLETPAAFERLVLMFQKEVADRLIAQPRSRDYGRLSVLAQWLCRIRRLFDIPPSAFTPRPKVVSTLVELVPRSEPLCPAGRVTLERVTAAAFGQRRKMLRQSLRALGPQAAAILQAVAIPGTARAEELTIQQFCAIARALEAGPSQ